MCIRDRERGFRRRETNRRTRVCVSRHSRTLRVRRCGSARRRRRWSHEEYRGLLRKVFDDQRVQRVRLLRRELVQRAVLVEKNRKSRRGDAKVEKWSARRRFECSLDERDVDELIRESGADEGWNEEDFEGTRFHNNAGRIFYDSIETRVAQKIGGISHGFSGDRERVSRYKL